MDTRLKRWLGIAGLAFVVLFVVSFVMVPSTPTAHASVTKVVAFYHKHHSAFAVNAWVIELAVFVGVFFFWYLRDYVGVTDSSRRLGTVGFAGALLFATTGGIAAGINFALADAVNHASGTTIQTLNVLQNYLNVFLGGAGVAIFLTATGVVCILNRVLPRWLGWIAVVLAVVSLALPFLGPPAAGLWVLIASIVILLRARDSASVPSAAANVSA
jgi:hypothetical protein